MDKGQDHKGRLAEIIKYASSVNLIMMAYIDIEGEYRVNPLTFNNGSNYEPRCDYNNVLIVNRIASLYPNRIDPI